MRVMNLGRVLQVEQLNDQQTLLYAQPLAATLDEYIRMMDSARIAFGSRCVACG